MCRCFCVSVQYVCGAGPLYVHVSVCLPACHSGLSRKGTGAGLNMAGKGVGT